MKGLSRAQMFVLVALGTLTLFVCIISFVTPLSWIGKPFAGFLVYAPPHVGSYSVEDWPGRTAGLKFLDRIVSVEGQPVRKGQDVVDAIKEKEPGTPVPYVVESEGQSHDVTIPVDRFGVKDFLLTFLMTNFLCGFAFCVLGFIVVLLKPNMFSSWVFLVWSICVGGYLISGFEIMSSYNLVHFHYLIACLYPVITLHLALIFPDKKQIVIRFPALQYLIYLPFLVLIIAWQIYLLGFTHFMAATSFVSSLFSYKFLGSVTRVLLLLSVVIFIVLVFHSMRKASTVSARLRARLIFLGAAIGWVAPVVIMLGSHILKMNPTWNFLPFLVIVFPITIAYSIVRHNLFDADVIIRRTVGYAVVTIVVVGAYALVSVALNVLLEQYQLAQSKAFPILFTLGVILVFNPLRDRIQALVDRIFFRKEYDYGHIVEKVGEAMTSLMELPKIANRLVQTFINEMFISTSSVMLLTPDGSQYQVYMADGERKQEIENKTFDRNDPIVGVIEGEKRELTKSDVLEDPKFRDVSESCAANFDALHASLMVPLVYQDQVIGSLNFAEKKSGKPFNREDIDLLRTLAHQGAVAIENARLFQENLEKQRMEEELNIARDLQVSMLPATCPQIKGFEIAASSTPAREVGGDFYDFIEMGEDKAGMVIADVTGKSVSGALVMSSSRSVFRMLSEEHLTVSESMMRANRRLKKDVKTGMFVALLFAVLNAKERAVTLCSAGQTQPVHYSAKTGEAVLVDTEGDTFPLGILEDASYEETRLQLEPGDKIVLYTDGIVEAMNAKEEIFGFERFLEVVKKANSLNADELLEEIKDKVNEFVGDAEQHDDLTVIVISVSD